MCRQRVHGSVQRCGRTIRTIDPGGLIFADVSSVDESCFVNNRLDDGFLFFLEIALNLFQNRTDRFDLKTLRYQDGRLKLVWIGSRMRMDYEPFE